MRFGGIVTHTRVGTKFVPTRDSVLAARGHKNHAHPTEFFDTAMIRFKTKTGGFRPASRRTFCSSATKSQQKLACPAGGMFVAGFRCFCCHRRWIPREALVLRRRRENRKIAPGVLAHKGGVTGGVKL